MVESIAIAVLSIGGLSLLFGALLGFSAKKFAVEVDPKTKKIISILPGVNCGGCGFPGCSGFAEAVTAEKANYKGCPVAPDETVVEIAKTMGIEADVSGRSAAFLKCSGIDDNIKRNYIYDGPKNCIAAAQLAAGGSKSCIYACLGLASCEHVCPFDAISMVGGIAEIDRNKCTACGICVSVCPKKLISIAPDACKARVLCNSKDSGKVTRKNCRAGCIGCGICKKACTVDAITIEHNLAVIDYGKCTSCMACVGKCPVKVIKIIS